LKVGIQDTNKCPCSVSSSKELKDNSFLRMHSEIDCFILKGIEREIEKNFGIVSSLFHPQRNWKCDSHPHRLCILKVSSSKELKGERDIATLAERLHSFILKGIESSHSTTPSSLHLYTVSSSKELKDKKRELLHPRIPLQFHPQRNWKLEGPRRRVLQVPYVSSSKELKVGKSSPSSVRSIRNGFILKGIESSKGNTILISLDIGFHPQRNWKIGEREEYKWGRKYSFILKGIESNKDGIFLYNSFRNRFHPQRNWK